MAFGLFTKEEIKFLSDLPTAQDRADAIRLFQTITLAQIELVLSSSVQKSVTVNQVVHTEVEKYISQTSKLDTVVDATGQQPNYTKLISVSWNL